jgi:hypothetical protein
VSNGDEISKSASQLISHYLEAMLAAEVILTPEPSTRRNIRARRTVATGRP